MNFKSILKGGRFKMITDAFDKSEVLFGPKDFYGEQKHSQNGCKRRR
jgi:hypothetical protein